LSVAPRVKAIAIICRGNDVLLSFAIDPDSSSRYGRFLGGAIEPGERASDAVRRELREEIGVELGDVVQLGVVENRYEYAGRSHHETVVVFAATFADPECYNQPAFPVNEAVCDGPAEWVRIDGLRRGEIAIYPPELLELIERAIAAPTPGQPRSSNRA
jgi:ADP-ribose pyrophosphatase YjhB (NUDIX family)